MSVRSVRRRLLSRLARAAALLLALLLAGTVSPTPSGADGDPASDVLLAQNVFFPYQPAVNPALMLAMNKTVHAAHAAGLDLKVAIIGTPTDLGLVQKLFGRPQAYAQFLDSEISFNEPLQLLVVMPNGFGVVPANLAGTLAGIPINGQQQSDGLTRSAMLAVVALARHQGHPINAAAVSSSSSGSSPPALLVFGLPAALLALAGVFVMRRGRSRRTEHPSDEPREVP